MNEIWAAVFATAYVKEHYEHYARTSEYPVTDEDCDSCCEEACTIADLATAALKRSVGKAGPRNEKS